jgi:D-amino-acid oxidase
MLADRAGVIGLQTAISLLEDGYRITILAKHFPGDRSVEYTSPWYVPSSIFSRYFYFRGLSYLSSTFHLVLKVALICVSLPCCCFQHFLTQTNHRAGAQWRSHASAGDTEQQKWDIETYNYWLSIIARELNEPDTTVKSGLGVCFRDGLYTIKQNLLNLLPQIYDSLFYSSDAENPWFAKNVLSFKAVPSIEIAGQTSHGHTYNSVMINVPMYLDYLHDTAISLGATCVRATLPRSSNLAGTLRYAADKLRENHVTAGIDAFVNATGISAKFLVPDEGVYPVRGQTITVKGEAKRITTIDASPSNPTPTSPSIMYILPRPHSGTSVLGGTKQAHSWNGEPDPKTTAEILERAKKWAPELLNGDGEFEVVSVQVGLRPGREGGARVELEQVRQPGGVGDAFVVAHAYGHAGAGYQNSVGSAKKVVGLLEDYFGTGAAREEAKL